MPRRAGARFLSMSPPESLRASDVANIVREIHDAARRIRALATDPEGSIERALGIRILAGTLDHEAKTWAGNVLLRVDASAANRHTVGGRA